MKKVRVGNCVLGSQKIYIQSMLNVPADDIENSVKQAVELEKAGCEIIRAAVPKIEHAGLIEALKNAASSRADLKALKAELLDNVDNLVEVNFVEAVAV